MKARPRPLHVLLLATAALASGCDPVINLWGSFFPAWVVSLAAGLLLAALLRLVFSLSRLEGHLGSLIVVYPSLVLLLTCAVWLVFFRS